MKTLYEVWQDIKRECPEFIRTGDRDDLACYVRKLQEKNEELERVVKSLGSRSYPVPSETNQRDRWKL